MIAFRQMVLCVLVAAVTAPAAAQTLESVDERVDRLERELRAVQRKVFPGGNERFFEPEIVRDSQGVEGVGVPVQSPAATLTTRIDALEQQLATLTGQIEQNEFQLRQLSQEFERFQTDAAFRLQTLEGGAPPPAAPGTAAQPAAALDDPLAQYEAAYALYQARDWPAAETRLRAFMEAHPEHERASNAAYWLGRALLQQDRLRDAGEVLLSNYQDRRDGARAPDSLLWVGKTLMRVQPPNPERACQAYVRLADEYAGRLSDEVESELADARAEADCG